MKNLVTQRDSSLKLRMTPCGKRFFADAQNDTKSKHGENVRREGAGIGAPHIWHVARRQEILRWRSDDTTASRDSSLRSE